MSAPASRLVRASKLPTYFQIPTTYHRPFVCFAVREGNRVRVTCRGVSVLLRRSQRVRVLAAGSS